MCYLVTDLKDFVRRIITHYYFVNKILLILTEHSIKLLALSHLCGPFCNGTTGTCPQPSKPQCAHAAVTGNIGCKHCLILHVCFALPGPPNLTISKQKLHSPQSLLWQASHFLHLQVHTRNKLIKRKRVKNCKCNITYLVLLLRGPPLSLAALGGVLVLTIPGLGGVGLGGPLKFTWFLL